MTKKLLLFMIISCLVSISLPSCKAKSCDTSMGVTDEKKPKKSKKTGLFSNKEKRRNRW